MSANTLIQIESRLKTLGFTKKSEKGKRVYTFICIGIMPIVANFIVAFNGETYTITGTVKENDKDSGYAVIYEKSITVDAKYFDGSATKISNTIITICKICTNQDWGTQIWRGFWFKDDGKLKLVLTQNLIGSRVRYYYGGGLNARTLRHGTVSSFLNNDKVRIYVEDNTNHYYDRDIRGQRNKVYGVDFDNVQFESPLPVISDNELTYPKQVSWLLRG